MSKLRPWILLAVLLTLTGHRAMASGKLPAQFIPHVPARAITYQRIEEALGLFSLLWLLIGIWAFVKSGASSRSGAIAEGTRRNPGEGNAPQIRVVAVYYLLFSLWQLIWMLPISISGHLVERHYGFSNESWLLYSRNEFINWLLNLSKIVLIWGSYRIYSKCGASWWKWVFVVLIPIQFAAIVLSPILIAPIFYRFTPLQNGTLRLRIEQLAQRAGIPHSTILVENTSVRSNHVNAYVTGLGPSARIVIDDNALRLLPQEQILAMVGHEMGHYVEHHIWILFISNVIGSGFLLWLLARLIPWLDVLAKQKMGLTSILDIRALPLLLTALFVLMQLQMPVANAESRMLEHRADAFGLRLTHLNVPMAQLFVGFAERDYADPNPPAILQWWYGTHPTLDSRIKFALSYHPWPPNNATISHVR